MRSITAAVLAVGLLLGAGTPAADGAEHRCQMAGSTTVASSSLARVFQRHGVIYGCLRSVGRRFVLTRYKHSGANTIEQYEFRLSGRYVAYGETKIGKEYRGYFVYVHDLRNGRQSVNETGATPKQALDVTFGNAFGIGPAVSVRLRASGEVAWIARAQYPDAEPQYEVRKREGRKRTLLARANDIDPKSLRLRGDRLTWRQGTMLARATLGQRPRGRSSR